MSFPTQQREPSSDSRAAALSRAGGPAIPGCGDEAPDLDLVTAGGTARLSDFRGSPVILVFHPPHWDPARSEHVETYNRLIASLPGIAGARLLSIGADGPWRELSFPGETLTLAVLTDPNAAGAVRYGVAGTAAVFVIDAQGIVRWSSVATTGGALPEPLAVARAISALARPLVEDGDRARNCDVRSAGPGDRERPLACTRRDFVATALAAAFVLALAPLEARAEAVAGSLTPKRATASTRPVRLTVNGRELTLQIEPRVTLLDALREHAGLTGTKKGCDHGQCGACTVHIDDRRELSCLTFAVMQEGKRITTIEGLAGEAQLHPVQQAFIAHDGFQCGYCTSGQIMSAAAVLEEPWGPSDDDVREAMSGNICRCGAYPGIVAAVQEARRAHAGRAP